MPRANAHLIALACAVLVPSTAAASTSTGGTSAVPVPTLSGAECRTDCMGVRAPQPGSTVRVRGTDLDVTDTVIFLGARRKASDDVEVEVTGARAGWFDVKVPRTARTGRLAVVNLDGAQSKAPKSTRLAIGSAPESTSLRTRSSGPAIEVEVQGKRVYFDSARKATAVYVVQAGAPADVTIELVRLADQTPIATWSHEQVEPGTPQTVTWNGLAGGEVQKDGAYQFRVYAQSADGARVQSAQAGQEDAPGEFVFARHKFPVRGAHSYGDGFGAGRGHEGTDVFAKCGTPLVAARGGVVKHKATHSRAGHYIVIDGQNTGTDYIYMHLREAALVDKGDRVRTGQPIGYVGDTGRASGCHLHFELWSAPGWYTGGSAFDSMPSLKAWDALS